MLASLWCCKHYKLLFRDKCTLWKLWGSSSLMDSNLLVTAIILSIHPPRTAVTFLAMDNDWYISNSVTFWFEFFHFCPKKLNENIINMNFNLSVSRPQKVSVLHHFNLDSYLFRRLQPFPLNKNSKYFARHTWQYKGFNYLHLVRNQYDS